MGRFMQIYRLEFAVGANFCYSSKDSLSVDAIKPIMLKIEVLEISLLKDELRKKFSVPILPYDLWEPIFVVKDIEISYSVYIRA